MKNNKNEIMSYINLLTNIHKANLLIMESLLSMDYEYYAGSLSDLKKEKDYIQLLAFNSYIRKRIQNFYEKYIHKDRIKAIKEIINKNKLESEFQSEIEQINEWYTEFELTKCFEKDHKSAVIVYSKEYTLEMLEKAEKLVEYLRLITDYVRNYEIEYTIPEKFNINKIKMISTALKEEYPNAGITYSIVSNVRKNMEI